MERKGFHYLLIIDFTGMKKETFLRKGNENDQYCLMERLGYCTIEIMSINDQSWKFENNLHNEEFPDPDYPPRYQYQLRNSASLIDSGINTDLYRLVDCGNNLKFDCGNNITIIVRCQRIPLHKRNNIITLYIKHPDNPSRSLCVYHSLPLQNHRFFICEIQNQIYVICVKIVNDENYNITCDLIYQGSKNHDELSQHILNYSEHTKVLSLIKHKDHVLKIIKEIPFDNSIE
jgi:hypothetical protein